MAALPRRRSLCAARAFELSQCAQVFAGWQHARHPQRRSSFESWGPEFGAGVVITPDGKKLAINNGAGNGITLWDLATHEILKGSLDQRQTPLTFLELSPDGKVLATGSFDGLVRLWYAATGDELL